MHEFFFENLRNPARNRRAGLMHQFRPGQVYSINMHLTPNGAADSRSDRSRIVRIVRIVRPAVLFVCL
jgi:hypothetical protein